VALWLTLDFSDYNTDEAAFLHTHPRRCGFFQAYRQRRTHLYSTRAKHVRIQICRSGIGRVQGVPRECYEHFLLSNFIEARTGDMERSRIQIIS
jgi:hypothetical protein